MRFSFFCVTASIMALTLKDYLDRPLDDYCSEILSEWHNNCINQTSFDIPIASRWRGEDWRVTLSANARGSATLLLLFVSS